MWGERQKLRMILRFGLSRFSIPNDFSFRVTRLSSLNPSLEVCVLCCRAVSLRIGLVRLPVYSLPCRVWPFCCTLLLEWVLGWSFVPHPAESASVFKAFRIEMQVVLETFLLPILQTIELLCIFIVTTGFTASGFPCLPSSHLLNSSVYCSEAYIVIKEPELYPLTFR